MYVCDAAQEQQHSRDTFHTTSFILIAAKIRNTHKRFVEESQLPFSEVSEPFRRLSLALKYQSTVVKKGSFIASLASREIILTPGVQPVSRIRGVRDEGTSCI